MLFVSSPHLLFIKGRVRDLFVILQSFIDGLGKVNGKA